MTNEPTPANSGEKKTLITLINEMCIIRLDEFDNQLIDVEEVYELANFYAAHIAKLAVTEALKRAATKVGYLSCANDILSIADEIDEIIKEVSE